MTQCALCEDGECAFSERQLLCAAGSCVNIQHNSRSVSKRTLLKFWIWKHFVARRRNNACEQGHMDIQTQISRDVHNHPQSSQSSSERTFVNFRCASPQRTDRYRYFPAFSGFQLSLWQHKITTADFWEFPFRISCENFWREWFKEFLLRISSQNFSENFLWEFLQRISSENFCWEFLPVVVLPAPLGPSSAWIQIA